MRNHEDDGYQWVIDLDIEKYFDTVNHDKLISIIRERVNDKTTLHLIRSFLKSGIMEDGLVSPIRLACLKADRFRQSCPSFITRLESFFVAGKQLLNLYR
nr:reverse transcriptase domain-containing protein [Lactobacillus crispatus]